MKKFILGILILLSSSSILRAYSNPPLEQWLDTLGTLMEQKFSPEEQIQRYTAVEEMIQWLVEQKTWTTKNNFLLIISWLEKRITALTEQEFGKYLMEQRANLENVDFDKIKTTWLQRHNEVRGNLGLAKYRYHEKLGYSAFTWSKHLIGIGSFTHQRKSTDWFYNYESIKEWFSSLGVEFSGKGTVFSENIAGGSYQCKSWDCTDILLTAMKKNFNFFMNEANSNWPHYRAIVHRYFNTIGVGIFVKHWKYYIVTHYGRDVK